MTTPAEVIARIAESMARTKAENERLAARAAAYTGPERRRGRSEKVAELELAKTETQGDAA